MNGVQLELPQGRMARRETRRRAAPELARRMIAYLHVAGGAWVTRERFREALGLTPRECRLGREASHGRIIMGQRGFLLLKHATPEEVSACLAVYQSQIRALQREHGQLCRRAHAALAGGAR